MKKIYLLIIAIIIVNGLYSQSGFHKFFPLPGKSGILYRTSQTSDGGSISIGKVSDFTTFDDDFLIMKADASGNATWIRKYSTTDSDEFTDVIELTGGGFVVVGSSFSMTTFLSTVVVQKLSAAGVPQWTKTYSMADHSAGAHGIAKDVSGNLYVFGNILVDGVSDDYYIMKLDADGNILTQTTFGTPDMDFPLGFLRKANGDFFICGWDNTFIGENIHLLKINSNMTVAWNKKISGAVRHFCYDMAERADGNLAIAGRYDDGGSSYDILLCTIDASTGDQVWAKSYSSADDLGTFAYGLAIAPGDAMAVTGIVETPDQGTFLLSTSSTGTINWSYKIGAPGSTGEGYGVAALNDGFLVCGPLENSSDAIVQLIKTNLNGVAPCHSSTFNLDATSITLPMQSVTITTGSPALSAQSVTLNETTYSNLTDNCLGTMIPEMAESATMISPNPSDGRFTVTVPASFAGAKVTVYNSAGIEIFHDFLASGERNSTISKTISIEAPAGLYVVKIDNGKQQRTSKLSIRR